MRWRCVALILALTAVFAAPGAQVDAQARPAPTVQVSPGRVVVRDGVVCAFLKTNSISRKFQWKPGILVGKNRFRSYSSVVTAMRKGGARKGTEYRQALSNEKSGDRVCGRLTSLRFKTSGFVAIGVRSKSSVSSKHVHSAAIRTSAIGELFGVRVDGTSSPVIGLVDPADTDAGTGVSIWRVYQAPDGSIYTLYRGHPEGCRLGRVEIGSQVEVCVLSYLDLPEGISFGGLPVYINELTEPVKFDGAGHAYVIVSGIRKTMNCNGVKNAYAEHVIEIGSDGSQKWLESSACLESIGSWATLPNGGVIYWTRGAKDGQFCYQECSRLMTWKDGISKKFLTGFTVAPNGLRVAPDGNVMVALFDHSKSVFNGSNEFGGQGGILKFDEKTETLAPWYHYRASGPVFTVEDVAGKVCGCNSQVGIMSPLVRSGSELFGVSMLHNGTTPQTAAAAMTYLWRVYPTVEPLVPMPSKGMPTLAAAMTDSVVVSTSDYVSCNLTAAHFKYPDMCRYTLTKFDLMTRTATTLVSESDGIAVLTLTGDSTGTFVNVQAIRTSDKKYLVGVVDPNTTRISWTVSSTVQFEQLTLLDRVLNTSQ